MTYCIAIWCCNLHMTMFWLSTILKMANEVYGILYSNVHPVSGEAYPTGTRNDDAFLRDVITPIYEVLRQVRT